MKKASGGKSDATVPLNIIYKNPPVQLMGIQNNCCSQLRGFSNKVVVYARIKNALKAPGSKSPLWAIKYTQ
jgi:hypothetical protein